ncbi:MAG: transposase [Oscillospiraceae bacterium]|nr:transposase [Oscillospiraceae bacterium]
MGKDDVIRQEDCKEDYPLELKPLLTLKEDSRYTGIGINKHREMSNECSCNYVLFVGRKRMFKREALLKYLEESNSV